MSRIESYLDTVLWLAPESIAGLGRSNGGSHWARFVGGATGDRSNVAQPAAGVIVGGQSPSQNAKGDIR